MATSGTGAIATFGDMASITGVTISGTYDANQCIKYSDITVTGVDPRGTLSLSWGTATTSYSVFMNPLYKEGSRVTSYTRSQFNTLPKLNCQPVSINGGLTSVNLTLISGRWPGQTSGMYVYFICKTSSAIDYQIYEFNIPVGNVYALNGGGPVSSVGSMYNRTESEFER